MNYLDYIIIAFVAVFTFKGLFRGLIFEVVGFLAVILAFILATKYMSDAAKWVDDFLNVSPTVATILGFLLIFFAVILIFQVVAHFLHKVVQYSFLGWLEKLAGGMVGFLKGAVAISLIILLISFIPLSEQLIPGQNQSKLFTPTRNFAPKIFNFMMKFIPHSKSFYDEVVESIENLPKSKIGQHTHAFLKSIQEQEDREEKDTDQ